MLYKPKYCCNCAEKIERTDWNLLTSRRFCDVCSAENKRHDNLPRAAVAGGVLSIMFGLGTLFGGGSPAATPIQTNSTSPAQLRSEKPPVQVTQSSEASTVIPKVPDKGSPEDVQTVELKRATSEKVFYCGALTKKGTPCSRKVKSQGGRCYQHEGKPAAAES